MPSIFTRIFSQSKDLATCPYANEAFSELVTKIQAAIDRLNLEGYANLEHQVAELDKHIEGNVSKSGVLRLTAHDGDHDGRLLFEKRPVNGEGPAGRPSLWRFDV